MAGAGRAPAARRVPCDDRRLTGGQTIILLCAFAVATAAVYAFTPVVRRVAVKTDFYDRPGGVKGHGAATPYLGGAAVVAALVVVVAVAAGDPSRSAPLLGGVVLLWLVGTVDDRRSVSAGLRVTVEASLAVVMWRSGLGWELGQGDGLDLAATVAWVLAVVNAFNLFDNMDGAAGVIAAVVGAGAAVLGVAIGDPWLGVVAVSLCGACLGFLPHNLSSPARIFLGDGGSMPIGFAAAVLVMAGASAATSGWQALAIGLLLVGIPALDTSLVMVSRTRRGISVLTGGQDHLTHRALRRFRTASAVAFVLGGAQAVISSLALIALRGGSIALLGATVLYFFALGSVVAVLDKRSDFPLATGEAARAAALAPSRRSVRFGQPRDWLLALIGAGLGLSPLAQGYYDSEIWVPLGLGLLIILGAGVIARPPQLGRAALGTLAAVTCLAGWALASSLWSESVEQAVVDADRLILYAILLGLVLVLLRLRADAWWLLGGVAAAAVAIGAGSVVAMLGSGPEALFLVGRLDEPMGYINGQASFYLMAIFPCLALAEQRRSALGAGVGVAALTLLAGLVVLSQTRGAVLAAGAAVAVVLLVVPGRTRRAWALVFAATAVTLAGPALLEVYTRYEAGNIDPTVYRGAGSALALAAPLAGLAWGLAVLVAGRLAAERPRTAARARTGMAAVLCTAAAAALIVGVVAAPRLADRLDEQLEAFVELRTDDEEAATGTRLISGAGNRYDYWRVARVAWGEEPVIGVGAGSFGQAYFSERRTDEDVRQPHSLPLQVLSELGLVGGVLLLVVVGGVVSGVIISRRPFASDPLRRYGVVAGAGIVTAWAVQTCVDWIHLVPGATGIAIAGAGVLLMPAFPTLQAGKPVPSWTPRRILVAVTVGLALVLAALSLTRQGLGDYFRGVAQDQLAERPEEALESANRSLRVAPEALESYYVKAAAFARFGEAEAAEATLREATRREPGDFVPWTLLGDLAVRQGRIEPARSAYRRALKLNPRDPALRRLVADPAAAGTLSNQ